VIDVEAAKLGTPASHGCVRLATEDAQWLYRNIPTGTPVSIRA
ncbi:MAG: L,D-transpeptidase, partial [Syntrophomonadaceae bacterium]|nr:L,D-transpeptidase [Syntrophomonadaceae bacterium]NLN88389.1 L,D-transpeptidase [Syntrophomonadaceae bacterium]